jgi:hypothetical protein
MIVQTTDETDLESVARRALPTSASEQTVSQTVSAIWAANPGLNLDSITPGMVIIVPNTSTTLAGPAIAAEAILSRVESALTAAIRELATTATQTNTPALTAVTQQWIAQVNALTTGSTASNTDFQSGQPAPPSPQTPASTSMT